MNEVDFSRAEIVPLLPGYYRRNPDGGELPEGLVGGVIVRFGTLADDSLADGGLAIDYRKPGSKKLKRVVFSFSDRGMWVLDKRDLES